jgi:hypothetical protein
MDQQRLLVVNRSPGCVPSRRDTLVVLAGAAIGLALRRPDAAAARKKGQKNKKRVWKRVPATARGASYGPVSHRCVEAPVSLTALTLRAPAPQTTTVSSPSRGSRSRIASPRSWTGPRERCVTRVVVANLAPSVPRSTSAPERERCQ